MACGARGAALLGMVLYAAPVVFRLLRLGGCRHKVKVLSGHKWAFVGTVYSTKRYCHTAVLCGAGANGCVRGVAPVCSCTSPALPALPALRTVVLVLVLVPVIVVL